MQSQEPYNKNEAVKAEDLPLKETIVQTAKASPPAPEEQDNPGTGTFPPDQQGNIGRSQPAGLSGQVQYGEKTPEEPETNVASPLTGPEEEEEV